MNKREKVRVEQIGRVGKFGVKNAADWTAVPPAEPTPAQAKAVELFAVYNTPATGAVARLEKFETGQVSSEVDFHAGTTTKAVIRHGIMLDLGHWNEAAASIASAEDKPEIMDGFHPPHGVGMEKFAAKVSSICDHAMPLQAEFVALGFDNNFITEMRDRVTAFGIAKDDRDTALQGQVGAGGGLGATIAVALKAGKQLNVLMKNLYKDDADKLGQWNTAFHTERVGVSGKSKKKAPAAPTPPTP